MKSAARKRTDRLLIASTAIVLLVLAGFSALSILRNHSASNDYLEQILANDQQLVRMRISSSAHELEEVLRMEAAWLSACPDLPTEEQCVERWRPLLSRKWAWREISVADEHGDQIALQRSEDTLLVRITEEGSQRKPAEVRILHPGSGVSDPEHVLRREQYDPRASLWFSKALEDTRDAPIWTIDHNENEEITMLQISLLLRPIIAGAPFRVITVDAESERIPWLNEQIFAEKGGIQLVLNSDGNVLNRDLDELEQGLQAVMTSAIQQWNRERSTGSFRVALNEKQYLASFSPVTLNGQTLYSGILLDADMDLPMVETQRHWLYLIAALLIALTALLATLWGRSRAVAFDLMRKERQSRSQELRLAKALDEREVLNREVHHRVKNNLQVMSSLLNLQASSMENDLVRNEFLRGKQRIDTIALVHHKLYALKDLRNVDLDLFFKALTQATAEVNLPNSRTVSFEVDTQGLKCDQDTAIGLGIILCELMTNAFRHAFPYATGGHIDVLVQAVEGDLYRLVVKDNGRGLDPSKQSGHGKLGLEIVDALSDQLDGSFHMPPEGGTTFEVLFRMRNAVAASDTGLSDSEQ